VRCETQQEVDEYWSKLSAGGTESQCGWLKDKSLGKSCPRACMLRMKKLDIAELERTALSEP
jgi:predicted 3-demethylubiquinone-9 3-methyltransferase (glyoxalase superfamily)